VVLEPAPFSVKRGSGGGFERKSGSTREERRPGPGAREGGGWVGGGGSKFQL
jgi:hypothetical protein